MSDLFAPVVGDPAGMRALAGALRNAAGSLDSVASSVSKCASGLSFEGPAAQRLQDATTSWEGDVTAAKNDLVDAASLLERAATQVEAERAAQQRRLLDALMHPKSPPGLAL